MRSAWLYFHVSDNAPSSNFSVVASASNTNLIPGANLVVGQDTNTVGAVNGLDWFLKVTPASNASRHDHDHADGYE